MSVFESPLKLAARAKIKELLIQASQIWNRDFPNPIVDFELKGTTGGKYFPAKNKISINEKLLFEYKEKFIEEICAHEFSHFVNHFVNPHATSHGPEFYSIGVKLGYTLTRTHKWDTTNSRVRGSHELYCGCKKHIVSTTLINRMARGRKYTCKKCGEELKSSKNSIGIGKVRNWTVY